MTDVVVRCRDVTVGYDRPVLEGINLEIRRGEVVALLGGSGCGKSTLLRAITGLLPPLAGTIELFGEPIYELSLDDRNTLLRRTGSGFQQDALFGTMTIGDNVGLPLRELTKLPGVLVDEMVRMRLALVGLAGMERRSVASLSGGQRKRAALARASILDPELILCDEPSSGLDPVVAAGIDETLLEFRASLGCTLVVVTHELASIKAIADRALMFANGKLWAEGTVAELSAQTDDQVYRFFHRVAEQPTDHVQE